MFAELPLPPLELRKLVGPTEDHLFDNPSGQQLFPDIPIECYESVFDFGCGCGRLARQLIQQATRPVRYVGIDLHEGLIGWCQANLVPAAPNFSFLHHDVHNLGFNPASQHRTLPFPVDDGAFKLVIAWSVFTHLLEDQVVPYLHEVKRILAPDGIFLSTWFTFDKTDYPMMQSFQNALYINSTDPTNAAIFDREWLKSVLAETGLKAIRINPPGIRGFQWKLQIAHVDHEEAAVDFPLDNAHIGLKRPPVLDREAFLIGRAPDEQRGPGAPNFERTDDRDASQGASPQS